MRIPKGPRLYGERRIRRILSRWDGAMHALAAEYRLPCACLQAVVCKELREADVFDLLADLAVRLYWLRYALRRRAGIRRLPKGKSDSSTGYAQVFAATAIRSVRFAAERGLAGYADLGLERLPDPSSIEDVRRIWLRLHRDALFNLRMAALTLLAAAGETAGTLDLAGLDPQSLQIVFSRYNADTRRITPYGEDVYRLFLAFSQGTFALDAA